MRFSLSDDQRALRDGVRALLRAACPPATVRAAWPGGDETPVRAAWERLTELGLPGAAVPEDQGGLGLDERDVVPLLEETGRVALPLPIVETAFVAAPLLAGAGDREGLLPSLIDGRLLVACSWSGEEIVPYGQRADVLLVERSDGTVRLVRREDAVLDPVATVDGARSAARLVDPGEGVVVTENEALAASARRRGALGTAAQLIGVSRHLLEASTAYVNDRHQFGVPVGSFQAIKHQLADALLALEFAAPAVLRAADSEATAGPDAERDVSMAKALASEAATRIAGTALQCHGAIAYTVEYDLHLYLKRTWALAAAWGDAEHHRTIVADALGLLREKATA